MSDTMSEMEAYKKSQNSVGPIHLLKSVSTAKTGLMNQFFIIMFSLPFLSFFEVQLLNTVSEAVFNENVPLHGIYLMIMCLLNELHGQEKIIYPLRPLQYKEKVNSELIHKCLHKVTRTLGNNVRL